MTPQNNPTINPARTSNNVCCFTMMRAVPSIPDSKMKKQSHDTGLKLKIKDDEMFEDWKKAQGQKPDDFEEDDTPYAEEVK